MGDFETFTAEQIARIYDVWVDDSALEDVIGRLAERVGATCHSLFCPSPSEPCAGVRPIARNLDPDCLEDYLQYYGGLDLWWNSPLRFPGPSGWTVVNDRELVDDEVFLGSEFYNDFLRPQDIRHVIGVTLRAAGMELALGLQTDARHGPYGEEEIRTVERLVPHLQRAIVISRSLDRDAEAAKEHAWEHVASGMMLVSRSGRIVHANAKAAAELRRARALSSRNGNLRAMFAADQALLEHALGAATDAQSPVQGATVAIRCRDQAVPLIVTVAPLPEPARGRIGGAPRNALLILHDAGKEPAIPWAAFTAHFDLTPAEQRLCQALVAGQTLAEIAESSERSLQTLKAQLRSVHAKTDTGRQADLIRLVMRFASTPVAPNPT